MPLDERQLATRLLSARGRIMALALAIVGDHQAAEDVFQDTGVIVLSQRSRFTEGTDFSAWAMAIARRVALNHSRKRWRRHVHLPAAALDSLQRAVEVAADDDLLRPKRDALAKCIAALHKRDRELVTARYAEAKSLAALVGDFGASTEAVRSRVRRIRQKLLECVSKRLKGEP